MRARLLALAVSLPLAAGVAGVGSFASAAPSGCGHYPPGNAYGLRGGNGKGAPGKTNLNARVTYPGASREQHCGGKNVVYFLSGPGEYKRLPNGKIDQRTARFHKTGSDVSDADGLASIAKTSPTTRRGTFLWYAAYQSDNHTGLAATPNIQVGP